MIRRTIYDALVSPFEMSYATKLRDSETGLSNFGHRYYSSHLGRFINRDPIGEQDGVNLYAYCSNNPLNNVDALGLYSGYEPKYSTQAPSGSLGWDFNFREDETQRRIDEEGKEESPDEKDDEEKRREAEKTATDDPEEGPIKLDDMVIEESAYGLGRYFTEQWKYEMNRDYTQPITIGVEISVQFSDIWRIKAPNSPAGGYRVDVPIQTQKLAKPGADATIIDAGKYQVAVSGKSVAITLRMQYQGRQLSQEILSRVNGGIEKYWNGQFGDYSVYTTVEMVKEGPAFRPGLFDVGGRFRSSPSDWDAGADPWDFAHEVGHLLNINGDRYDNSGRPLPGFDYNIMGVRGGLPSGEDIEMLLQMARANQSSH